MSSSPGKEARKEAMESEKKGLRQWIVVLLNGAALSIGTTAGPLLLRFYFVHGGSRLWFSSWMQTAGWPLLIPLLSISYTKHHNTNTNTDIDTDTRVTPTLFLACVGLGVLTGLNSYMYAWGVSCLPISTSSLLSATQLGFNAVFAYLVVSHKFTPYSVNAVILLTMGPVLLAFSSSSDRPPGLTTARYWLGFVVTIGAAALCGLIFPLIEFVYKKTGLRIVTYRLTMKMQVIIMFSATVFCTVGMVVNKDFQAIAREARESDLGELNYYMAIVWSVICWQLCNIGVFGVIFLSSALLSGLILSFFMPVGQLLAVIIFHDKFSKEKGMALAMALWGFASYLYGEKINSSKLQPSNMNTTENGESANLAEEEKGLYLAV